MSVYKIPIESAFIIFPIIAFLFTLPYLIHQYNKYGSVLFFKSIIVYSFILYLINAYFMVILPLPSIDTVAKLTTPIMQLHPFAFASDIIKETSFHLTEFSTYLPTIENNVVYTVLFNVLLTMPFGMYLRYYFKKDLKRTILYSFLLSLFFELTQLSGLYGIYPRPYRLFDVDDLIVNTFGGIFGYIITPLFTKILPSRTKLDSVSYEKGKKITFFRRLISFNIDFFFLSIISIIFKIIFYQNNVGNYSFMIALGIYYLLLPMLFEGQTFGKMIIKMKVVNKNEVKPKFYQVFFRYLLGYPLFIFSSVFNNIIVVIDNIYIKNTIIIVVGIYSIINAFYMFLYIIRKKPVLFHEKLSGTKLISSISHEEEVEDEKKDTKELKKEV